MKNLQKYIISVNFDFLRTFGSKKLSLIEKKIQNQKKIFKKNLNFNLREPVKDLRTH